MHNIDLSELSGKELLDLYKDFIKWHHYEAVDEFRYLKEMNVDLYDIEKELLRRIQ